jgi:drug/metabolite transporter (DMT)-like permease
MEVKQKRAILFAILAASLYALSAPLSKKILEEITPTMMAAFLYLGAGVGLLIMGFLRKGLGKGSDELKLAKGDLPYTIGMVVLDIAAPIFLMLALTMTGAANVSLLTNFEIVATSVIAFFIFKETISKRLWAAIILVTISSMILSINDMSSFHFSIGSLFVILACVCWGLENNCTRMLSDKSPLQIVVIKGICSGTGSLVIALILGERCSSAFYMLMALILGFVAYGLSIYFYIYAQRELGAAKTSTYYAVAPFIGVLLSLVIFREVPSITFIIALVIMIIGTYLASTDNIL